MNLASLSCRGGGNGEGQEVPEHSDGDECDVKKNNKSSSGASKQKEEDEMVTVTPSRSSPDAECLSPTIIEQMKTMFLKLGFTQECTTKE